MIYRIRFPRLAFISALLVSVALIVCIGIASRTANAQGAGTPLTGFLWSDTIGWISLNCSNLGTCGTSNYNMAIATDGTITGYAWSEHVGWVSANASDMTGCPTAPCTARMNGTALEGWFRVLAGGTAQSGSWDGFIGLNGVGYGPTLSGGTFSGYAWGDVNVGWVSFAQAQTTWSPCVTSYVCTDSTHRQDVCTGIITACTGVNICSTGVCVPPPAPSYTGVGSGKLKANPSVVRTNGTSQISWSVQDATSCTVTGNGNTWNATSSPVGGYTSSAITITTTYTLACSGAGGTLNDTVTIVVAPEWKEI